MTQAFYSGISGVRTHQSGIDITANNLANISTVGYRSYNSEFASLFERSINTTSGISALSDTVGVGTRLQASTMNRTTGSLQLTDRSTDLAIYGNGWFGVSNGVDSLFTRAGNFTFDANNDLVTPDGMYVMGTMAGNIQGDTLTNVVTNLPLSNVGAQESLRFPKTLTYPAEATTEASFYANLGTADEIRTVSAGIVDTQGVKNNLKLTFTQSEAQVPPGVQWDVVATVESLDGEEVYATQAGALNFDATGALISSTLNSINHNGTNIALDLGSNYSGIVATSANVTSGYSTANGTIAGELYGYEINRNAEVIATFSNGKQSTVGKIGIFHFQNEQGLERVDSTKFRASSNSGEPLFYQDAEGNNILGAEVLNYQLETSNVRMDAALTELIIYQRAFDASSKLITTADEMIQKAINMSK